MRWLFPYARLVRWWKLMNVKSIKEEIGATWIIICKQMYGITQYHLFF